MKFAQLGFHMLMAVLLVAAVMGVFSPPKTGSLMQDSGSTIMPTIGVLVLWITGAIVLRIIRSLSSSR